MKKNIISLFSLLTMLTISGCNGNNNSNNSNSNVNSSNNTNSSSVKESSSSSIDDSKVEYKITIVLDDNTSVGAGVRVQLCKLSGNGLCTPATTDSQGIATFNLEPAAYSIDKVSYEGYALEYGLKVDENNRNLTVTLQKVLTPSSGEGNEASPFVIHQGVYQSTHISTGDIKHYGMTFNEVGTYVVESWSNGTLLEDPKVIDFDERLEADKVDPTKKDVKYGNFKVTFEIKEENLNVQYVFSLSNEGEFSYEINYYFALKKL